jgi:hypothetical protein
MNLDKLKDIKASQTIPIDLLPYFLGLTVLIITIVIIILFFILRKNKKPNPRLQAIAYLKGMDFDTLDDKQIAYQFCEYGYICVEDHYMDEFKKIETQLETFKYKKEVPPMDKDLKEQMKDYIKVRL